MMKKPWLPGLSLLCLLLVAYAGVCFAESVDEPGDLPAPGEGGIEEGAPGNAGEGVFFLIREVSQDVQLFAVYRATPTHLGKVGERAMSDQGKVPMAWLDEKTFWYADVSTLPTRVYVNHVSFKQGPQGEVKWGEPQALPGRLLDYTKGGLLLIEPLTVWLSLVYPYTPFVGGSSYETSVRAQVGTVSGAGVSIDRRAWLPPLLETPRQREIGRLQFRKKEGCSDAPCDGDGDWADGMVRTPGDDVLVPELRITSQGAPVVSICLRSSGLGAMGGACLHPLEKTLFRQGGKEVPAGDERAVPTRPKASWLRVSEGVHQCTQDNQVIEFTWPDPPPDQENFCYQLVAEGAGVEVGSEDFPHIWTEGIPDVVVPERWEHWMGNTWLLSRNRDLCGDAPEEMDGDCSCLTYYLFDGCSPGPLAYFLEQVRGPGQYWSHPTGTKPSDRRSTVRFGARELGVVESWTGLVFAPGTLPVSPKP